MMLLSINDWWQTLSNAEQIFWGIALISSVLFVLQFIVTLFLGADFDGDMDVDMDLDAGVDVDHGGDYSLDTDFTLFSLRGIIAFFTFFGWAGVLALRGGASVFIAIAFAMISGGAALVLVAYLLYWFAKLTKEGNVNIQEALNQQGEVYLTIPAQRKGQGKVHITIGNSLREMDAVTNAKEPIVTGTKVIITDVLEGNVLVVNELTELIKPLTTNPKYPNNKLTNNNI